MRSRHLLLFPLFLLLCARSAYPLSISQYFDSNGTPVSAADHEKSATRRHSRTSQYAVPEGVELRRDISYEYYPVFGKSFSEAVRSAEENGPYINKLNRQATSKIEWNAGFSFQYDYHYDIDEETRTAHATIDISDVITKYNITITLPGLLDDTALSTVEKKLWRNYFERLLEQEHTRAAIIEDAELRKKLEEDLNDIKGLAFDNVSDSENIEHSVEQSVKEEAVKIGQGWIRKINERLDEANLKSGRKPPRRQPIFRRRSSGE